MIELYASHYEEFISELLEIDFSAEDIKGSISDSAPTLIFILENLIIKMKNVVQCSLTFTSDKEERHIEENPLQNLITVFCGAKKMVKEVSFEHLKAIQSYIHDLVSAFKITLCLYDSNNYSGYLSSADYLLLEFLRHSFKALTVFTKPCPDIDIAKKFLKNGEVVSQNLASILIIGPQSRMANMFPNLFSVILKGIEENILVKVFLCCLLKNYSSSRILTPLMLKQFSNISTMQVLLNASPKQASVMCFLVTKVFKSLDTYSDARNKIFQQKCLKDILRNTIESIPFARDPKMFISLLNVMCITFTTDKWRRFWCVFDYTLSSLFAALDVWTLLPMKSEIWHTLLETVLSVTCITMAKSILFLLPYLQTIIRFVIFSIKENSKLTLKALCVLDKILGDAEFKYINIYTLPLKDELLHALYDALRCPIVSINKIAFSILGKMKRHNRTNFFIAPKLQNLEHSFSSLRLDFKQDRGSIIFPLSKIMVDFAYRDLIAPQVGLSRKREWWFVVQSILDSQRECISDTLSQSLEDDISTKILPIPDDELYENPDFLEAHKVALMAMCAAAGVSALSEEVTPCVEQIVNMYVSISVREFEKIENQLLKILIDVAYQTFGVQRIPKDEVDISLLEKIVRFTIQLGSGKIWESWCIKYIVKNAIDLCYRNTWEEQLAGCKVIALLLKEASSYWLSTYAYRFIKPLCFILADTQWKISFGTFDTAKSLLEEIAHHLKSTIGVNYTSTQEDSFNDSIRILVEELVSFK